MLETTQSIVSSWLAPGYTLFLFVQFAGVGAFAYIVARRMLPLVRAQRDQRFDRPLERLQKRAGVVQQHSGDVVSGVLSASDGENLDDLLLRHRRDGPACRPHEARRDALIVTGLLVRFVAAIVALLQV